MIRTLKFLLIWTVMASAAPPDLSAWKYRKPIALTPGDGLAVVKLDRDVYIGSSNAVSDLLVVRGTQENPFVLTAPDTRREPTPSEERILDESVLPGTGLQFVMHLRKPTEHNSIILHTNEKNFRKRVSIETSQDGVKWAVARTDGAIFNFSQDGREFSSMIVEYPVSTRPFIRVTIFGWTKTGVVSASIVDRREPEPVFYEKFSTQIPQIWQDSATKSTVATVDQGVSGLPVSRMVIETPSPQFQRAVMVETSADGKQWQYLSQAVISRIPGPRFKEESLEIRVPGAQRYLRLRIYNRDDQPIEVSHVTLEGLVSEVKFLTPDKGPYWLYYGNPAATLPQYDLSAVLARSSFHETTWPLGPAEVNPDYRPPAPPRKPWSEQHPAILYTVLGGAVLALGIATFRFASRLRPSV